MKKVTLFVVFIAVLSLALYANGVVAANQKNDIEFGAAVPVVNQSPAQPKDTSGLLVPWDSNFVLAMSPNDDSYVGPINYVFNFSLYGSIYTECWINNNGNVTFDGGYSSYTPWGFPINGSPMLAPFFGDVDTRGTGSVWYKIEANRMIVIWDAVGYFGSHTDKLNTFELIFTDGTDPTIGIGNTVAFSYGDMAWTTGDASGGAEGFGGTPATVGINKGDGALYAQIGRFDQPGTAYDGGYDNNDGVDWLDNQLFYFNTGTGGSGVLIVSPSTVDLVTASGGYPGGTEPGDPGLQGYVASYPGPGNQTITIPVGPGIWRGWAWYNSIWNQADVFPMTGPGDLVWSNVPFGAKADVPILIVNDQTLPVELSSFSAFVTASNFVGLAWITQSETNMSGYRVYRNESADFASAISLWFETSTNSSTQHNYSFTDTEVETGHTYRYWLQAVEMDGTSTLHGPVVVNVSESSVPTLPTATVLGNAYPNPFRGMTNIDLTVKEGETAMVTVYNILGQVVRSYERGQGTHSLKWDGMDQYNRPCSSGIYFYRVTSPTMNQTKKLVLVR